MPRPNRWRVVVILVFCTVTFGLTIYENVSSGRYAYFPGPMSRHRDAAAVAISLVQYGWWDGYVSLRPVNDALRRNGLSVPRDGVDTTASYFEVMTTPALLANALKAATSLPDPEAQGSFYMQDEKGMALIYVGAFSIFGIGPASLFWFHMLLLAASLVLFCLAYFRRTDALWFALCALLAHYMLSRFLTAIPMDDVNVVQGNRFIGILGVLPAAHLMLAALYRERRTPLNVTLALPQAALLAVIVITRSAALWLVIATLLVTLLSIALWRSKAAFWPAALAILSLAAIVFHDRLVLDPDFMQPGRQQGHVFWHNAISVLHNNPNRSEGFGIPPDINPNDDRLGYFLFYREIAERQESKDSYLMNDPDWVFRTSDPDRDFRWGRYDHVLKDVFWRTVLQNPVYAAQSFFFYQPLSIITSFYVQIRDHWREFLTPVTGLLLIFTALAVQASWPIFIVSGTLFALSMLPAMIAAPFPFRIAEASAMLLLFSMIAAGLAAVKLRDRMTSSKTLRTT